MGLLTGFSIMSGVEIIFFLIRSRTNLNVQTSSKTHPPFHFKYNHMLPTGQRYAQPIVMHGSQRPIQSVLEFVTRVMSLAYTVDIVNTFYTVDTVDMVYTVNPI